MAKQTISPLYAQDGVNVKSAETLSQYAKDAAQKTYGNSKFASVDTGGNKHFRGQADLLFKDLPPGCETTSSKESPKDLGVDGVGTKVGLYQALGTYGLAPFDAAAMVVDDVVRSGALPVTFSNVLSVHSAGKNPHDPTATAEEIRDFKAIKTIYDGCKKAADTAKVILYKGETAVKGVYVGSDIPTSMALRFDIEAFSLGIIDPTRRITGETLQKGQVVIALKENGFRSNGFSSIRKAFATKFGAEWWTNPEAKRYIQEAAVPSIIYAPLISTLNGWYAKDFKPEVKLHAVAHITGGGINSKFWEDVIKPRGLSVNLNNLHSPPKIMAQFRKWREMEEREIYMTLHGGQGMLLVVDDDPKSIGTVIEWAKKFGIEAKVCGSIHKWKNPRMAIKSKFSNANRTLIYT